VKSERTREMVAEVCRRLSGPETRYANTPDGVAIAYDVLGAGPIVCTTLVWSTSSLRGDAMEESTTSGGRSIKVGVITDQTGPLSFMGIANANVAKMVIDNINAKGGLLGRQIDLYLEDSATTDSEAEAKATKLVQQHQVDVIFGGIYSSTRQAIKGPAVVNGKKLYIYPEQYEGQECDPLIFCTGPVPAQQVEPLIPWLMQQTGAKNFYLPSADYIWPHTLNKKVDEVATANGGAIVGEEYFPLDHTDYTNTIDKIMSSDAEVVFNTIVPPGLTPFLEQLYNSGFTKRGGSIVCTYFDENFLNLVPAAHVEGLYSCLDYYQDVSDPFSKELINQYDRLFPGSAKFTAGSACSGMYRGLRLWEAAVKEAGSLEQESVIEALDHAKIAEGPGGPAEMVPGQHHVRMNMYIAQAKNGNFEIVKSLGVIDPKECVQGIK
jgi:ABC-type branched-subunit amino acid transport system substrate-binding protein